MEKAEIQTDKGPLKGAIDLQELADAWPSKIVARVDVHRFTGGLVSPRTLQVLDSMGRGPKRALRFRGRRIAYHVDDFVLWLKAHIENVN